MYNDRFIHAKEDGSRRPMVIERDVQVGLKMEFLLRFLSYVFSSTMLLTEKYSVYSLDRQNNSIVFRGKKAYQTFRLHCFIGTRVFAKT